MIRFQENVSLAKYSNYKIGGPSRYFFVAKTADELREAIIEAECRNLKLFILGDGTNLIFSDRGFSGLTVKIAIAGIKAHGNKVAAGAGMEMDDLLLFAAKKNLRGLEWAGGLPGTVGGAVRGNAGAFGGETKDAIERVRSLNIKTLKEKVRANKACMFSYRSSIFKERDGEEVVLEATFALKKGEGGVIKMEMEDHKKYRRERQPLKYPNIGSIFKNVPLTRIYAERTRNYADSVRDKSVIIRGVVAPVKIDPFPVVPTAHLLSEAGLKGRRHGGAMISPKHPNFIINYRNAKASDIKTLIKLAQKKVKQKFGIIIEPEVIEI